MKILIIQLCFLVAWWLLWFLPAGAQAALRRGISVALVAVLLGTGYFMGVHIVERWYPRAIVCERVGVRVGPDELYGVCGELEQDDEVVVYSSQGNWSKVGKSMIIGWVPCFSLKIAQRVTRS